MSKNVVDAIIEYCEEFKMGVGFIPSRRQLEWDGGYVNNWTTERFCHYTNLIKQRDHAGPDQGLVSDDGYESLKHDCKYFNLIHIDPWKRYHDFELGLQETIKMIEFCYNLNANLEYEVGTEESIRRFEAHELSTLMDRLKLELSPNIYSRIKYLAIQSGTSLSGVNQTGNYDYTRLKEMLLVCKQFNVLSKEHNGDYISESIIKEKFLLGLDSINIAPEFGLIETQTYLDNIINDELLHRFWKICYNSKKWVKWVSADFNPVENKIELIKICGHYMLSNDKFIEQIKGALPDLDSRIKHNIKVKLKKLHDIII